MWIWNFDDGQIIFICDILNVDRLLQEVGKWFIDFFQLNFFQIIGSNCGYCICLIYLFIGVGEFKFWKVVVKDVYIVVVDDMFLKEKLYFIIFLFDVWILVDFVFVLLDEGFINFWILWKNNLIYWV